MSHYPRTNYLQDLYTDDVIFKRAILSELQGVRIALEGIHYCLKR
jgi:hypothetical protein